MKKLLLLAAMGAMTLAACTKTVFVDPEPEVPARSISLDKDEIFVPVNEQIALNVVVVPEEAGPVVWISENPSVASVSKEGVVKGLSFGEADIIAVAGKFLACCHVTVVKPITSITLNKESVEIIRNRTFQLEAVISPDDADEPVEWSSEDPSIATVDQDGLITAIASGKVFIVAKAFHAEAKCEVEVVPVPVEQVILDPESIYGAIEGQTIQFTANILPEDAEDKSIVWSVEDEDVATIDENGLLTVKSAGQTKVKATAANGIYGEAAISAFSVSSVPFLEDLENSENLNRWSSLDADGDGIGWFYATSAGHSGSCCLLSYSYYNSTALFPDNWIFTPPIKLDDSYNRLSFWAAPYNSSYALETYGAYLIIPDEKTGGLSTENAIGLVKGTLTQGYKVIYDESGAETASEYPDDSGWEYISVDIPETYNGKTVFIAIRHFDCTDQYAFLLDDVEVSNVPEEPAPDPEPSPAPAKPSFVKGDRNALQPACLNPFGCKIVK